MPCSFLPPAQAALCFLNGICHNSSIPNSSHSESPSSLNYSTMKKPPSLLKLRTGSGSVSLLQPFLLVPSPSRRLTTNLPTAFMHAYTHRLPLCAQCPAVAPHCSPSAHELIIALSHYGTLYCICIVAHYIAPLRAVPPLLQQKKDSRAGSPSPTDTRTEGACFPPSMRCRSAAGRHPLCRIPRTPFERSGGERRWRLPWL